VAQYRNSAGALAPDARPSRNRPARTRYVFRRGQQPVRRSAADINDTRGNLLRHFDETMTAGRRTPERRSGAEGVFLKWMIDENFGSIHHRML
jgi:hypothetical protein